jgi:hypothetical protein
MQADDRRFVNFPLCLLSETITEPGAAMNVVMNYAISSHADHCREPLANALVQLAYVTQRNKEAIPSELKRPAAELSEVTAVDEYFSGVGAMDMDYAQETVQDVAESLDESSADAVIQWHAERRSASFHGYTIHRWEAWRLGVKRTRAEIQKHESAFGPSAWCSVPILYFKEVVKNPKELPLARMVAAARSLVGRKSYTGTTKAMLAARCIGAKSPAVASAMAGASDALRIEYERMQSRKRFDRLLNVGAEREFYQKIGSEKRRRIFLSTEARSLPELTTMILNAERNAQRSKAEADARRRLDA